MTGDDALQKRLSAIEQAGRLRTLETLQGPQGARVIIDGCKYLNLCSNDYLSLAADPRIKKAAAQGAEKWGAGAGASRLLSGDLQIHRDLESAVAKLVGKQSALCFVSGYSANVGLIGALAGPDDLVISDRLNHASLIDGCRLSKGHVKVFDQADLAGLESILKEHRSAGSACWIVTESYLSMDGTLAPLEKLTEIARRHDAELIVDEAHAIGVFGEGRGRIAELGITDRIFAIVGTFGKSIGSQGAFVAGSDLLRSYLINSARSMIFSTALAPPAAAAALAGVSLIEKQGAKLAANLLAKCESFRNELKVAGCPAMEGSTGQIVPVILGDEKRAVAVSEKLFDQGVFAKAIRPPTVPPGQSRIRFSLCLNHTDQELTHVAKLTADVCSSALW